MMVSPDKILILDKDGTIQKLGASTEGHIETLKGYAEPEEVRKLIERTGGYPPDKQYAILRLMKERGLTLDDVLGVQSLYMRRIDELQKDSKTLKMVDALWEDLKKRQMELYDGVPDALSRLVGAGYHLVLSTGYREDIADSQLRNTEIRRYFDLVLGHPKGVAHGEKVMEHYDLGLQGLNMVRVVGDGLGDADIANYFGFEFHGIASSNNATDLIKAGAVKTYNSLAEFTDYLLSSSATRAR